MRYKIIISGPVGAGKTSAINALTDDKALKTDVAVSDVVTSQRKDTTTVALDYGVIKYANEDVVHIYGTPGQERFDFMWDILSEGAHGLILLFDNCRNYPFRDLKYYTEQFSDLIAKTGLIVGVTRYDVTQDPDVEEYKDWLRELEIKADVFVVDARVKEDIHTLVRHYLDQNADISSLGKQQRDEKKTVEAAEVTTVVPPLPKTILNEETAALTKMRLTEKSMRSVMKIQGVTGASLANDVGELIDSTIQDDDINEFIAFISGLTPAVQAIADMGEIHRIMLRGSKDENLTVFVEAEHSLGVTSERKASVPAISQQIEDTLQWM
ncbi:MAG: Unknown protein [uncultured Thiotrichaceae bacterium]|uniref:GTP-binding protein n=1 Tax=uncultured Thiotrichaceae bacterium TaxID=298394 RepID=A0A6S6SNM2_9GAMM|nr:MAG: Unknown protein [uncultured Thiotrichaceae bacterium]